MDTTALQTAVTARIIALLEAGVAPWQRPWAPGAGLPPWPRNAVSKRTYRGVNFVALLVAGHADPRWCTQKQAARKGWTIRAGATAQLVWYSAQVRVGTGDAARSFPLLRCSLVYNLSEIDGAPAPDAAPRVPDGRSPESEAARVLAASGACIQHGADRACYMAGADVIHLPDPSAFRSEGHYFATALHELAHWTGHPSRLDRKFGGFGDPAYAREELRAELASAMLSVELGVPHDPADHASYVGSWLEVLRRDRREIFRAAAAAQRIVDVVCGRARASRDPRTTEAAASNTDVERAVAA